MTHVNQLRGPGAVAGPEPRTGGIGISVTSTGLGLHVQCSPAGTVGPETPDWQPAQPPFLCPPCAQRLQSSLRRCLGDEHALRPECPDHHVPLRWTNGGELASCNPPTGYDPRGRRTWRRIQRNITRYDAEGHPMPTAELPVRTIGRSVRKLWGDFFHGAFHEPPVHLAATVPLCPSGWIRRKGEGDVLVPGNPVQAGVDHVTTGAYTSGDSPARSATPRPAPAGMDRERWHSLPELRLTYLAR